MVTYERNERADDNGDAGCVQHCWNLECQTLPATGGKEDEDISPVHRGTDGLELLGTEGFQAEDVPQDFHDLRVVRLPFTFS